MAGTTTELHRAIKHEDVEQVERLLSALDREFDVNISVHKSDHDTP